MIIAIDPGVHACAGAWFHTGTLRGGVAALKYPAPYTELGVTHVVVERPAYQGVRTQSARPQDLMSLSWEGAKLAGLIAGATGAHFVELEPSAWKGSEPKPVHHARLWSVLTDAEREILGGAATGLVIANAVDKGARERWKRDGAAYYPRTWVMHNVLDAVALGATYVGRLVKR